MTDNILLTVFFLDPASLRILGKLSVEKKVVSDSGAVSWVQIGDAEKDSVSLANHFVHGLFQSITVSVEGSQASFVLSQDYPYKAWIEQIFSFSQESARQQLISAGVYEDPVEDAAAYANNGATWIDHPNLGSNATRSKWLTEGNGQGVIGFCAPLHLDLMSSGRLWMDNCQINLRFVRTPDNFLLLIKNYGVSEGKEPECRIRLHELKLYLRKVNIASNLKQQIDSSLSRGLKIRYPITKTIVRMGQITTGVQEYTFNMIHSGRIPYMIICFLTTTKAVNGDLRKNPFNAGVHNCEKLCVVINNVSNPISSYAINSPNSHESLKEFGVFLDQANAGRFNSSNMITYDKWCSYNRFYVVDTTPDSCSGYHNHLR